MDSSRRRFLQHLGVTGAVVGGALRGGPHAVGQEPAEAPVPASPGAPLVPRPFKESLAQTEGISLKTHQEHYALYQRTVSQANKIRTRLQSLDLKPGQAVPADFRELKVALSTSLGVVRNHEIYFDSLGAPGKRPVGKLLELIARDFGSVEKWSGDLKASGMVARGWVWLTYDWTDGRLFNYLGDGPNHHPVWDTTPLLALDVEEHAYWLDYQANRGAYIDAFLKNIDWDAIDRRFWQLARMPRVR